MINPKLFGFSYPSGELQTTLRTSVISTESTYTLEFFTPKTVESPRESNPRGKDNPTTFSLIQRTVTSILTTLLSGSCTTLGPPLSLLVAGFVGVEVGVSGVDNFPDKSLEIFV